MSIERLGQQVKATRRAQKLTQEDLALTAGVGVRFIRELEQGKETCQVGKVLQVLKMLGLKVEVGGQPL